MTVYKLILGTSLVVQWLRICLSGERRGEVRCMERVTRKLTSPYVK